MATAPYFVISPNAVISILGLLRGPDRTVATPAEDWREAKVDIVIPALNEEHNIVLCLESVARQTLRPRKIILIDDGSSDRTVKMAEDFCSQSGLELTAIHRARSIGKTPTLKRQAREFDSDVEFVLDGDTILESENYLERCVEELYKAAGIASVCGTVLPLRIRDRKKLSRGERVARFLETHPDARIYPPLSWPHRLQRGITNMYRDVLYLYLQRFVYRGQMVFFGTVTNPVGCAVAYRRKYLKDLFDKYEPVLGDDLTNSEDIFIGFSLLDSGYRNVHLMDVSARSEEPEASRLPKQIYMWSSSFLQTAYYFNDLILSPFKSVRRRAKEQASKGKWEDKRKIREPYRQAWGSEVTSKLGRPMGWSLMTALIEKVLFPAALIIMLILGLWEPLVITLLAETALSLIILAIVAEEDTIRYLLKGIAVTPLRYASLLYDFFTIGRFATDIWILRSNKWRK